MTITLNYSDLHFDDDRAVMLAEETDFEYDLLFAQIAFRVDAADFTIDGHVPLLDVAARLGAIGDSLADGETRNYAVPTGRETLTFARSGDQVAISANYTEATTTVSFAELAPAVSGFHRRVVQDLLARYPGLDATPGARGYFAVGGASSSSSPGA